MASGMGVNENCVKRFNELKIRKTLKWIVYKIQDTEIVVEQEGKGDIKEFMAALPKNDCRFGVYDWGKVKLEYTVKSGKTKA